MALSLYNTLTRHKEPFTPLEPGTVKMYCCGVTVYDYCHLGHARSYIAWDTARRYLLWQGFQVQYVQNFTDIDDKILNRARKERCSMETISQRYTQAYFEDMARLNILEADAYTYATQTLDGIKRLIAELEQKGFAYATGGDVYYTVRKFDGYGKLSGRNLDDMQAGASGRVTPSAKASATPSPMDGPQKQDPFDFALWKAAKPEEPAWESPWGPGRPGWHIECSAMVQAQFGPTIDIHMGGADLVFPHHENEIAQSEAATGRPLAQYWLHNGMVNVGGEKMSKSLGNFTTIRALLDEAPEAPSPMALRLFVLQAQYRKPIDFTDGAIASAKNGWATLQEGLRFGLEYGTQLGWSNAGLPDPSTLDRQSAAIQQFEAAMDDDFNTSGALAVLFELAKELRRVGNIITHQGQVDGNAADLQRQWQTLVVLAQVLGLEAETAQAEADTLTDSEIEALLAQRQAARQAKDFAEGDRLRDLLQAQGITLIDKPGGVTDWHR